ncbi:MAG: host specificity factor TipJ family phage tail protein [Rhizomicrobium sp.]
MSARLAYVVNPMVPALGARIVDDVAGMTVSAVLAKADWNLAPTTVLVRSGQLVRRAEWDAVPLNDNEEAILVVLPLGKTGSQIGAIVAALAVAVFAPELSALVLGSLATTTVVGAVTIGQIVTSAIVIGGQMLISTFLAPPKPFSGGATPSPTYSLTGANNRARLAEAIPDAGGTNMIMCDLYTAPYVEYENNRQTLSLGLMVGIGEYDIHQIRLGQGVIWQDGSFTGAYPEIELEISGPADPVTLIEDNVTTSTEVSGITMLGTNEEGYDWSGPFVCSRPGTKALSLGFDFLFPAGLYSVDDHGHLDDAEVFINVEIQAIGNDGTPSGGWTSVLAGSFLRSTRGALRVTHRVNVTPGRYWARMQRTNARSTDKNTSDTIQWLGMRAYLPGIVNYEGVTTIQLRATATANVNNDSLSKVNVICTRKLPIYDADTETWSTPIATRNPAWYAAYMMRDAALCNLPDSRIPLDQLVSLAATWEGRGDWFDGVFDQRKRLWENLQSVLAVGRSRPFMAGSSIAIVRDEAKTLPVAAFSPRNMLGGSFSIDYAFDQANAVDALMIQFIDNRTWSSNQVLCALDDFAGVPEDAPPFQWFGITDREHAWREGMYLVAQNRYRRRSPNFRTEMEGRVCFLGSYIKVGHWLPTWSTAAAILDLAEDDAGDILLLSEPWSVPAGKEDEDRLFQAVTPDGRVYGPVTFDLLDDGSDTSRAKIRLTSTYDVPVGLYAHQQPRDWPVWSGEGLELERPRCTLGTATEQPQGALLVSMKPDAGGQTASVVCVVDDARVHSADEGDPPDEVGGPDSTLPANLTITSLALAESISGGVVSVAVTVGGASDALSFDAHWKHPSDTAFNKPLTGFASGGTIVLDITGQTTLELRARGAAGYGPWFGVTFDADGTTDTTPANVGTIATNGAPLGLFVSGTVMEYSWTAVAHAGSYLINVIGRVGGHSFFPRRGPIEVTTTTYRYYPADEIDDGGPWADAYIQVKAKNAAGISAAWTDSHNGGG